MKDSMNAFALAEKFLEETRANTKEASLRKAATDPSDPTTQPVMKAEDGTQPAREGSRSAENEADIRKALGSTGNTGQHDASSASSAKPTDTIGTVKQDADSLKGNAKQPKTEKDLPPESKGHPSNVTGKYASLREGGAKVLNGLIASLTKAGSAPAEAKPVQTELKPKDSSQPANPGPVAGKTDTEKKAEAEVLMAKEAEFKLASAKKYREDAEAGYMAADLLATHLGFNKEANDAAAQQEAAIQEGITSLVKNAQADADSVCDFLEGQQAGRVRAKAAGLKFANEALATGDAAATGEGEGGMAPPPGMEGGGMPPEAGGAPPGMEGGGGEIDPEVLQLVQALEAEGITPEQLEAALAQTEGGGGGGPEGGMPPGAGGGMPPGMPPPAPEGGAEPPPGPEKTGAVKTSRAKLASALRRLAS